MQIVKMGEFRIQDANKIPFVDNPYVVFSYEEDSEHKIDNEDNLSARAKWQVGDVAFLVRGNLHVMSDNEDVIREAWREFTSDPQAGLKLVEYYALYDAFGSFTRISQTGFLEDLIFGNKDISYLDLAYNQLKHLSWDGEESELYLSFRNGCGPHNLSELVCMVAEYEMQKKEIDEIRLNPPSHIPNIKCYELADEMDLIVLYLGEVSIKGHKLTEFGAIGLTVKAKSRIVNEGYYFDLASGFNVIDILSSDYAQPSWRRHPHAFLNVGHHHSRMCLGTNVANLCSAINFPSRDSLVHISNLLKISATTYNYEDVAVSGFGLLEDDEE